MNAWNRRNRTEQKSEQKNPSLQRRGTEEQKISRARIGRQTRLTNPVLFLTFLLFFCSTAFNVTNLLFQVLFRSVPSVPMVEPGFMGKSW
jgi:hypothetical protein